MEGLEFNRLFAIQFGIQLALFLSSFAVLKYLVFNPFLELIHAREHKTHGLKEAAENAKLQAEKLKENYETLMKSERKKISAWMDEEKKKVAEEEKAIIQKSRDEVAAKLQVARKQIQEDTEKVRGELSPLVADFASRIATKLVGRQVSITGGASTLKKSSDRPSVQG